MALSSGPWDGEIIIWIGSKLNHIYPMRGFPGGSVVKNPPAKQEIQIQSRGQEDPLEEEMATHSSILAWKIPWLEEPGGLLSMGLQRIGHDWAIELVCPHGCVRARTHTHTQIYTHILAEVYRNFCFSTSIASCPILFQDCNNLIRRIRYHFQLFYFL